MEHGEGHGHARVGQIGIEGGQLVGRAQRLVESRSGWSRRPGRRDPGGQGVPPARKAAPLGLRVGIDPEHRLLDGGGGRHGQLAEGGVVDRTVRQRSSSSRSATSACSTSQRASLAASGSRGRKAMAGPSRPGSPGDRRGGPRRIGAGGGVGAGEELLGQREQDARAVAGLGVGGDRRRGAGRRSSHRGPRRVRPGWPGPGRRPRSRCRRRRARRGAGRTGGGPPSRLRTHCWGGGRTPEDIDVQGHGKRRRLGERRCSSSYERTEVAPGRQHRRRRLRRPVRVVSASGTGGFGPAAPGPAGGHGPGRGGHGQQGQRDPERPQQRARVEPGPRPAGRAGRARAPAAWPAPEDRAEARLGAAQGGQLAAAGRQLAPPARTAGGPPRPASSGPPSGRPNRSRAPPVLGGGRPRLVPR